MRTSPLLPFLRAGAFLITHRRIAAPVVVLCVLLSAGGCAPGTETAAERPQSSRNVISQQQIEENRVAPNAYELVVRIRPAWLQRRGASSITRNDERVPVYINNMRYGDHLTALRDITLDQIVRIERLTAQQAQTRFGMSHLRGAIVVVTV